MATTLQFTRFVKSAGPDFQQNQALRHHSPNGPSGKMSKGVMDAQNVATCNLLILLAFAENGHFAHLPGHWANLARLDIHRHMIRTRGGVMHLVIPAEEVKNSSPVEAMLPADTVRLIDTFLDRYRPLLLNAPSPWLFPGAGGHAKSPEGITTQIGSGIRRHCGLQMNPNLFRHLAAKMYLDSHPGAYGVVRLVNGHKSVNTTTTFYCGAETASAMRHYDGHILELRRQAEAARLLTRKRNKPARRSGTAQRGSPPGATR